MSNHFFASGARGFGLAGFISLAILGTVVSQPARGATYYVSTSGSDSNAGTQSAPFLHVSRGVGSARNPGDTVIVMDGTYDNEGVVAPSYVVTLNYSGTLGAPITIMAQNRGQAILDSQNTSTGTACNGASAYFNLYNAAYVVIQGFAIQNACDAGFQSNDNAHDITLRWNEIRYIANRQITDQYGRDGIYLNNNEYNFTFDGDVWHDIGRTSGISLMQLDHGIYAHSANLTIINNVFYNMTKGWPIQLADGAANWLVANNTFSGPAASGGTGQIMFWGGNANIAVENNIFYQPGGSALTQWGATISGCTFSANIVYGVSSIMSGGTAGFTVGSNQTGVNPLFVGPSSTPPNFQLQSGSPAIAAGLNLAAVADDITGATRLSPPALGAYESGAAGPVITGVFVSAITSNSASVSWSTNEPATSYVQYGPSGYTSSTAIQTTQVTQHTVTVSNLVASTLYHFRAASRDAQGKLGVSSDYTFTTAAAAIPTTFSLSSSVPSATVVQGQAATLAIHAALLTGSSANVSFTASGQPSGAPTWSASTCALSCSTNITINTATSTPTGTFSIVITASGAGTSASVTVPLIVTGAINIKNGLVAQWLFNQRRGTSATDLSGDGNNGAIHNASWITSGPGQALRFSGSNSYVSVNESSTIEMSGQVTVSFWLSPSANSNTDPKVVAKLYDWDVKLNGSNRYPQFEMGGGQYAMLNYPLALNAWHFVAFTYSSGVVTGYVDGIAAPFLQNTFTGTGTLPQYKYGLCLATDTYSPFAGSLSDVRVYNRALSAAEIAAVYVAK